MNRRGRTIALWNVALGILILVTTAILTKERIREEWYLWQLRQSVEHRENLGARKHQREARYNAFVSLDSLDIIGYRERSSSGQVRYPSSIDSTIKAVDAKAQLVLLSAGNDQKVEVGYEFTVYRDSEFIAKVKVIRVYPNLCGAEVELTKDGAEIRRGDKASTSI